MIDRTRIEAMVREALAREWGKAHASAVGRSSRRARC